MSLRNRLVSALIACVSFAAVAYGQASYDPITKIFRLDGGAVTYAFGINQQGELQSVYWGGRIAQGDPLAQPEKVSRPFELDDTPQEFAGWGGGLTNEPAVKITFADGNRDLVLHYKSHALRKDGVDVKLEDISRPVEVVLHYAIDPDTGILARSATIENRSHSSIMLEQFAAAQWNLPASREYSLRYLSGRWGGEDQLQTQSVIPGSVVLESRRGLTGHECAPWFAIAADHDVTEREGKVWFGSLAWSGDWRITVQQDVFHQVHVTGGFNPFDFGYSLQPGAKLESPVFYGGVAHKGYGEMTRLESVFQRTHILPHGPNPRPRPVIYNSWEATGFNVSEAGQISLAEKATSIGVERFVMDDGWFSTRKDDHSGLGDWWVNRQKFPNGLGPLIAKVHALGMDFGLWVEPEMVNSDSDLYRKHPEWIIHFDGRPKTEGRNQYVLNLAIPDVQEYLFGVLDKLVSRNDIAFLKWDANRNWSEPGWPQATTALQKQIYVDYTLGYYSVLRRLRLRHPDLEIQSCSGGGGRVDLGAMALTDEVWPSDNTDPFDRLQIQDGFTYAYTPQVMTAWVTDSPNWYNQRSTSLAYRFLSSMQGALGVGADLTKWTPVDFDQARNFIADYKKIRSTVQQGTLYRLISPRDGSNVSATESVSNDRSQAVAFVFIHSTQMGYASEPLMLQGLRPDSIYLAHTLGKKENPPGVPSTASGSYWMQHGILVPAAGDFSAFGVVLEEVEENVSKTR